MTDAPTAPEDTPEPDLTDRLKAEPPSIVAFLSKHPTYVLLGLTLWSLLISVLYVRSYLSVFRAEVAWFAIDPLQFAAGAFNGYAWGLVLLGLSVLLVPHIGLKRGAWIAAYVLLVLGLLASLSRPLFSLGSMVWTDSPWVLLSSVLGVVWLVAVPVIHRLLGAAGERGTVQSLILSPPRNEPELRWASFGLTIIASVFVVAAGIGIGQVTGWNEALRTRNALEASHERHVEFLRAVDEGGYELDVPPIVTEHVVFSDGSRQLVAHTNESSIWIALEEGGTAIDPCVIVLKGGVLEAQRTAE